ncbi:MAG: methyltransferase domain-containing protein [Candidatus Latescibacteria bacterium]|nr:methyltransferase domain-containing protein [Candidatus Latescibacterota bacterium]
MPAWLRRLFTHSHVHHLSVQDGYARWAKQYDDDAHNPAVNLEEQAIVRCLPALDGRRVLDAGCGTGRQSIYALNQGARLVVGIDLSEPMLNQARRKGRMKLLRADLCVLPFSDASFDVVICSFTLDYVRDFSLAIAELSRVTVPGGTVVVSDLHPFGSFVGWNRAFRHHDGTRMQVYLIDHTPHLYAEYTRACRQSGLVIEEVVEPRVDEAARPDYEAQGSLRAYEQHQGLPIVLIMRLRKIRTNAS